MRESRFFIRETIREIECIEVSKCMETIIKKSEKKNILIIFVAAICVAVLHLIFILLSGKHLLDVNVYNSYTKQAMSWLQGRLDLGQNYPWLELAVFEGKYYVSFPPFPSYVLLPFALVFGEQTPDHLIAFIITLIGVVYSGKIALHCKCSEKISAFIPVFLYCSNSVWQITVDGWVWFFAQNLAFTLTLAALYHSMRGHVGRSAFFLCAAIGCRPFQVVYFPVICFLIFKSCVRIPRREFLFRSYRLFPSVLLAISFMLLNYLRFGNPIEFGHNYLPEFVQSKYGQFSIYYLKNNIECLFRLPLFDSNTKRIVVEYFNGINFFLVFPIIIVYMISIIPKWKSRKSETNRPPVYSLRFDALVVCCVVIHITFLCLHKTMGGAHFGNRYIADTIPVIFTALVINVASRENNYIAFLFYGFSMIGLVINFTGTLGFYNFIGG